jgi:hypothetical protein
LNLYEMSAREIYAAFVKQTEPREVLELGREQTASQLMVDDGLDQETAYYAADQILPFLHSK